MSPQGGGDEKRQSFPKGGEDKRRGNTFQRRGNKKGILSSRRRK